MNCLTLPLTEITDWQLCFGLGCTKEPWLEMSKWDYHSGFISETEIVNYLKAFNAYQFVCHNWAYSYRYTDEEMDRQMKCTDTLFITTEQWFSRGQYRPIRGGLGICPATCWWSQQQSGSRELDMLQCSRQFFTMKSWPHFCTNLKCAARHKSKIYFRCSNPEPESVLHINKIFLDSFNKR